MKEKIKFVHISDVHLGANPYMIKERYNDMKKVFEEAIMFAIDKKVDFVVIAGDLFDKKVLNAETLDQAINLIKLLNEKDIPIYVTEGNHDMATYMSKYSWLEFMSQKEYIYLLKPISNEIEDWDAETKIGTVIEKKDYIIYGLGYPGVTAANFISNIAEQYKKNKDNKVVISMLHTGIDKFVTEGMGGLREQEINDLIEKSDYIALGHIHQRYECKEKKYYNPGSLENTSIPQKVEEKGFYYVSINKSSKDVEVDFIKTNSRKIMNITIDSSIEIDEVITKEEKIAKIVSARLKENGISSDDNAIVQIKLRGEMDSSNAMIDINKLKEIIQEDNNLLYVEIQNKINSKKSEIDVDKKNLAREDIDRMVIKGLISDLGFDESDVDKLLNITMKMKEVAANESLTLEKEEGIYIKEQVLKFIREKREGINEE